MLSWPISTALLMFSWSLSTTIASNSSMAWTHTNLTTSVIIAKMPQLKTLIALIRLIVWRWKIFSFSFWIWKLFLSYCFIRLCLSLILHGSLVIWWALFFREKWNFIVRCTINSSWHFFSVFFLWKIFLNFFIWKEIAAFFLGNSTDIIDVSLFLSRSF